MAKTDSRAAKTLSSAERHKGHRERLRQRFSKTKLAGLQDYEILELILFYALPRRDTKAIAKNLLKEFDTISAVLSAPKEQLTRHKDVKDAAVHAFHLIDAVAQKITEEKIRKREVIGNWRDLITYCRAQLAEKQTEEFRMLLLDNKNHLIRDEVLSTGTVNHTTVYPREVIRRALLFNATSIILVHNHPSGDATPSQADIEMTQRIKDAAERIDIRLHDHLVIGRNDTVGFKQLGLL